MVKSSPSGVIYLILFVFYFLFNILFPADHEGVSFNKDPRRIYAQVSLVLILLYTGIYIIRNFNLIVSKWFYKPLWTYLFMTLIYLVVFLTMPNSTKQSPMEAITFVMKIDAAIIVFFGVCLNLTKTPRDIKYFYWIFIFQLINSIFTLIRDYYMSMILQIVETDHDTFNSNSGFMLASLIPMCFLLPWKRLRIYIYFFLVAMTIFSGQRTASLAVLISLPFALKYVKMGFKSKDYLLCGVLAVMIVIPFLIDAVENILMRNEVDAARGEVGSGRNEFWMIVIYSYLDSNPFSYLLGNGYFSVNTLLAEKYGNAIGAHNGFIDHLYTFGIIGILIYFRCFHLIYKIYKLINKKLCKNYHAYASLSLMMFLIIALRSAASHGYFDVSYIPFFMALSIVLLKCDILEQKK